MKHVQIKTGTFETKGVVKTGFVGKLRIILNMPVDIEVELNKTDIYYHD